MKENFSFNPVSDIKSMFIDFLMLVLKIVLMGLIINFTLDKSGLNDDGSVINYIKYFVIGSAVLYVLTFLYFMYRAHSANGKYQYTKYAKASFLALAVIFIHIVILISSSFIEVVPELGLLISMLVWSSFGIVVVSGLIYNIAFESASKIIDA